MNRGGFWAKLFQPAPVSGHAKFTFEELQVRGSEGRHKAQARVPLAYPGRIPSPLIVSEATGRLATC